MQDVSCVQEVKDNFSKYTQLLEEFKSTHTAYCESLTEDEAKKQDEWLQPKITEINDFVAFVSEWLSGASKGDQEEEKKEKDSCLDLGPMDSASQTAKSRTSSVASAKKCAEAEKAALEIEMAALAEKHDLQEKEEELSRALKAIKQKREALELRTKLEASSSKLAVLTALEDYDAKDAMNDYLLATSIKDETEDGEKDAVQLISDLVQLCSKGGFHLTKWVSNSRLVLASIKEEARGKEIRSLDLTKDQLPTDRALGLQWKVEDDTFRFDIKVAEKPLTRRGILSMVSSMYDPLDWTKLLKAVAWYLKFGDYLLALAAKRRHATGQVSTRAALRKLSSQLQAVKGEFSSADSYTRRRWKQVQYLADVFWRRWSQEYLSTMQQRQKWFKVRRNFEVGDLVVIVDPTSPRASWPLARVLETRPDSKGLVRSVKLRTKTGLLERPVTKICLLLEKE
ncbi:hypothetical protein WMY93_001947 [Mugilogobius chulae]|uniref:DUF5641 domain-containing protein n=1 Tax=Mugilogobius chulae TaxID=88201 RepID=A0AAW0PSA1_9GOBI